MAATMPQQTAMARETGPQYRSLLEREAKLPRVPSVNKPVRIHIPVLPVPGIQSALIKPAEART